MDVQKQGRGEPGPRVTGEGNAQSHSLPLYWLPISLCGNELPVQPHFTDGETDTQRNPYSPAPQPLSDKTIVSL